MPSTQLRYDIYMEYNARVQFWPQVLRSLCWADVPLTYTCLEPAEASRVSFILFH